MKLRKELWFGLSLMAVMMVVTAIAMPAPGQMTSGHYGLLMLALVVAAIMLGFPTAFTLMGMGVLFAWIAFAYDTQKTLDLMVQRAYAVMTNDVLISIPLFVFMGYLVERANLVERLFKSIHLAMARIPGSLAVATLVTCAIFATATGIVGAVVTLMGLLAFPAMLRHGYDIRLSAGAITAGGCLGILIPPSVMLIVYGATAGVSVVQLYAGAFFPGLMLAGLYVLYVIVLAVFKPKFAPPLSAADRVVTLSPELEAVHRRYGSNALFGLLRAMLGGAAGISRLNAGRLLFLALMPFLSFLLIAVLLLRANTSPLPMAPTVDVEALGDAAGPGEAGDSGLTEPPWATGDELQEPPATGDGVQEAPAEDDGVQEPPTSGDVVPTSPGDARTAGDGASGGLAEPPGTPAAASGAAKGEVAGGSLAEPATNAPTATAVDAARAVPTWLWWFLGGGLAGFALYYALLNLVRMEVFRMLLSSFFPLSVLILAVLGSIVFGLATPSEAAAVGALGGVLLAAAYRQLSFSVIKESTFLTAKTSAMVCWLFVGSSIFSAAFALLGGQEVVEKWVLSLEMSPVQFLILSQCIIFLLGWPLEWTEIIVIFMPIFVPLLQHFHVDPLFFGLLVAMNLQTAFLSPPVAMAAFYLKGVAPPHVTLNQIFVGMLPFMGIQVVAIVLLYIFPEIGLWLPGVLYR